MGPEWAEAESQAVDSQGSRPPEVAEGNQGSQLLGAVAGSQLLGAVAGSQGSQPLGVVVVGSQLLGAVVDSLAVEGSQLEGAVEDNLRRRGGGGREKSIQLYQPHFQAPAHLFLKYSIYCK